MSGIEARALGAERVRREPGPRRQPPRSSPSALARLPDPGAVVVVAEEDKVASPHHGPGHERRWNRHQDPGAVTGAPVGCHGAAVADVREPLERGVQDLRARRGRGSRRRSRCHRRRVRGSGCGCTNTLSGVDVRNRETAWDEAT